MATYTINTAALVKMTYLDEANPTLNYGASNFAAIGLSAEGLLRRAVIEFDASARPAGAITGAEFRINNALVVSGGGIICNLHRLTGGTFTEGTANGEPGVCNWTERAASTNWASAGGDFDPSEFATLDLTSTGTKTLNNAALLAEVIAQDADNNGMIRLLLRSSDENSVGEVWVTTDDVGTEANRPHLILTIDVPPEEQAASAVPRRLRFGRARR